MGNCCLGTTLEDNRKNSKDSDVKANNISMPTIDKRQPLFDNHSSDYHASSEDDHTSLSDNCTNSESTDLEPEVIANTDLSVPTGDAQMQCKEIFNLKNSQQPASRDTTLPVNQLPMSKW